MRYFLYKDKEEAISVCKLIDTEEKIGLQEGSTTTTYTEPIKLKDGGYAIICDQVTSIYIKDEPVELNVEDFG